MSPTWVIRIIGYADGTPSEADGMYVSEYDPDGVLELTPDRIKARHYLQARDAFDAWQAVASPPFDRRPDGEYNRPLTAYTVTVEKVP